MSAPNDLLAEAELLAQGRLSPARRRTVVSRAYYAACHFLMLSPEAAAFRPQQGAGEGSHRQFIRFLTTHPNTTVKFAGRKLDGLYGRRILADYYLAKEPTNEMVKESIEDAIEIVREIFAEEEWQEKVASGIGSTTSSRSPPRRR